MEGLEPSPVRLTAGCTAIVLHGNNEKAGGESRTRGLSLTRRLLYRLSYTSMEMLGRKESNLHWRLQRPLSCQLDDSPANVFPEAGLEPAQQASKTCVLPLDDSGPLWSGERESNPQHPAWKAGALPIELPPRLARVPPAGVEPTTTRLKAGCSAS